MYEIYLIGAFLSFIASCYMLDGEEKHKIFLTSAIVGAIWPLIFLLVVCVRNDK